MTTSKPRKADEKDGITKKKPSKPDTVPTRKCDVCGMLVQEVHCRLVCPKCGASSDCSDP